LGVPKLNFSIRCNIGALLKAEGRSQTWLAKQIKVPSRMVSDWCNNRYSPHIGYILRIIKVTGWKLEDMFEEE
jgi:DNA-binding XRE family transcriptional regulator